MMMNHALLSFGMLSTNLSVCLDHSQMNVKDWKLVKKNAKGAEERKNETIYCHLPSAIPPQEPTFLLALF